MGARTILQLAGSASLLCSPVASAGEACTGIEQRTYDRLEDGELALVDARCLAPDEPLPWIDAPIGTPVFLQIDSDPPTSHFDAEDLEGDAIDERQIIELVPGLELIPDP